MAETADKVYKSTMEQRAADERVQVSVRLPSMAGKIAFEESIRLETGTIVFTIFGIPRVLHALYSRDGVLPDDVTHDAILICVHCSLWCLK